MHRNQFIRLRNTEPDEGSGTGDDSLYDSDFSDVIDTDADNTDNTNEEGSNEPPVPAATPSPATAAAPTNPTPAANPAPNPPAQTQLDDEAVKRIAKEVGMTINPPAPKTVPVNEKPINELTPEEFDTRFKRFKITPQFMNSIGLVDATPEQMGNLQSMADGIATHAIEMAQAVMDDKIRAMQSKYSGMEASYNKYEAERVKSEFFKTYPHLQGQDKLLQVVAKNLSPTKPDGSSKTNKEIYEELNVMTMQILQSAGVNPQATTPNPQQQTTTVPKANVLAAPGRSSQTTQNQQQHRNPGDADIY